MPRDAEWMRRAIQLSRRGTPAPNPHVGCVIVKDGHRVGQGFHPYAGGYHAEIVALNKAGEQARGATAYVTLEPCNHTGRTGPCSEALIRAGIRRVVVACPDPNPRAQGGTAALRAAGVEVEVGLLRDEAAAANPIFLFAHEHQRPMVVAKAAMSLDGRIALPSGESQYITETEARRQGMMLRAECGAVLVGRRTAELDRPRLTVRGRFQGAMPLRVVLDPSGTLDPEMPVFDDGADTLWCVREVRRREQTAIPWGPDGFDLRAIVAEVWRRGICGLLVEGGGETLGRFLRAGLVDRLELFVAGKVLGAGPSWLEGGLVAHLADAPRFEFQAARRIGPDLWISARRTPGP